MNRRSFFRALGIGTAAIVAAPVLKYVPLPKPIVIPVRKMIARVRITQELLEDSLHGLPSADWINDGTYHSYYHGLDRRKMVNGRRS